MGAVRRPVGSLLLVEDDPEDYELLSDRLAAAGFDVHGASDGEEALTMAIAVHPHVVIADFILPGMNGCELACRLRRERRPQRARFILISGHPQSRVSALARKAGCDGFLAKPFHPDDLLTEIERVLALPRRRLLLVEDDAEVRTSLREALEEDDYDVVTATNGLDALDWLRHNELPDAILLDLMMPVMDGFQFLAEQ